MAKYATEFVKTKDGKVVEVGVITAAQLRRDGGKPATEAEIRAAEKPSTKKSDPKPAEK